MIYFVQRTNGDIKIGTTTGYHRRYAQLATEHGQLQLLGLMDGSRNEEQHLHQRFLAYRVEGEWFCQSDEISEFINNHTHLDIPQDQEVTVRLTPQTLKKLHRFQSAYFLNYGNGLNNNDAIALAIEEAIKALAI